MKKQLRSCTPDKRHAAVCGLFCPSCTYFIGTKEDPEKLKERAKLFNRPVEELECYGCRSEKLFFFCKENCAMRNCATEKGIDFCGEGVSFNNPYNITLILLFLFWFPVSRLSLPNRRILHRGRISWSGVQIQTISILLIIHL
ncbi:MAG: DUF3795 domain-containing protein [Bacillota bacterium]|nr:DUF3795 domain-containing protein [Bacillota bacterium]